MKKFLSLFIFLLIFIPGSLVFGEGNIPQENIWKAEVVEVIKDDTKVFPGTDQVEEFQILKVKILEGASEGKEVEVENDYLALRKGEKFYLIETLGETGEYNYAVKDKYRLPAIYFFLALFLVCLFAFGGIQGLRGLLSLIGSMVLIIFVLLPGLLEGYSPIIVTLAVSSLIIILGSYVTHGFNRTTSSAVIGMIFTVIFTGFLAYIGTFWAGLSGFESEEAVYLNWNTGGSIDLVGLLLGGMIIGLLGVLYDVAIGQAVSVEELREVAPHLSRTEILKRVLRIGREHTGALVNTLAIAYVGASLPLLLLLYGNQDFTINQIINREIFATEIMRTLIGSIGLVLAVPITSVISVFMLIKQK